MADLKKHPTPVRLTLRDKLRRWKFIRTARRWSMVAEYRSKQIFERHLRRRTKNTILFYPELPTPHHALYKICCALGYKMTNNPNEDATAVVTWQDQTCRADDEVLRSIAKRRKVLNYGAADISKRMVERIVKQTFGYGTFVDPTSHRGLMVEKSDANAQHDGRLIEGPIKPDEVKPEKIYQLLVDNSVSDTETEDIRLGFFGDDFCYCMVKRYQIERRFADRSVRSWPGNISELFTPDEIAKIRASCRALGLDLGALDLARDRRTGLLHLLDMNSTPSGPIILHRRAKWAAIERMGKSFERQVVS